MVVVVAYCLKHKLSFKVWFRDNKLISNKNYIEIIVDFWEGSAPYNELKKWLEKGAKREELE